jgi:hypothetical protein
VVVVGWVQKIMAHCRLPLMDRVRLMSNLCIVLRTVIKSMASYYCKMVVHSYNYT